MNRRNFIKNCIGAAAGGFVLSSKKLDLWAGKKPNIVLIVSDDMGYSDLGCYGGTDIPTPRIDSIAASGIKFTNGYVSCPLCSPTRAGLLTGRYQQRFGYEENTDTPEVQIADDRGLPLSQITFANILKDAGYKTCAIGKWHQGMREKYHPLRRGFDEFFGFLHGGHSYVDPLPDSLNPILRNYQPVNEQEYLTDAFGREAAAFVDRNADEPFFLYLAFNAVHTPMQIPDRYIDAFLAVQGGVIGTIVAGTAVIVDEYQKRIFGNIQFVELINYEPDAIIHSGEHARVDLPLGIGDIIKGIDVSFGGPP